ncbi:restriction endonuclease subunit S [Streptomyces massasporeus]|uniref:restriction endonuclease subunit S n=1 Tax=Streptomyces massasporeus TaxID=67324 RepID=UPI0036C15455
MSNPSELPEGWAWATLDEIADSSLGKMLDRKKGGDHPVPYLRNVNVQWGRIDTEDVLTMSIPPEQQEFFRIRHGDLLVCEGGEVGRCAVFEGDDGRYLAFQKALHRVRPLGGVSSSYLRYYLEHLNVTGGFGRFTTGSTIKHLPQQQLKRLPVRVPPLDEQRRIVARLEEQLSRLDAALASVCATKRKSARLLQSIYDDAASGRVADAWRDISNDFEAEGLGNGWVWRMPSDLTDGAKENIVIGPFGSNLKVSDYEDAGVPLVFVRNVRSGDFASTRYVSQRKAEELKSHSVTTGDLLITKMGEPPGDAAAYREAEDGIVTADCIRLRPSARWDVNYLVVAVNSTLVRRQIEAATRGVAQRKVSLARFREGVKIPVPPESLQSRVMREVNDRVTKVRRLQEALDRAETWAEALRRSLLAEAFAGRLVSQDPTDEPASTLLARIRAEREETGAIKPRRRGPRRTPAQRKRRPDAAAAPDAPPPPQADGRALVTATQPTLDLEIPS